MGEIWAAWMHDPRDPRRVAIKIIRPGISSELSRELFTREMEMHDRVRDVKGVIPLLERGTFEGPAAGEPLYYFAMEWISTARPLTQACEGLTLDRKVALFMRVCETMDVVHKRAIVHCDIKPANILVDEHGTPWLTDFGLAISTRTHERKHTGWDIGSLRGTWSYMAPEQCDERCDPYSFTPALDVYSLGVSFYECITGRLPYSKDPASLGDKSQAAAIIRKGPRVPRRVGGRTLPPTLRSALMVALARRPEDRHADAGQLGAELRPLVRNGRAREWVMAVVLVLLVLAAGEFLTAPLLNSRVVYSRWYTAATRLVDSHVKLENVTIVANRMHETVTDGVPMPHFTGLEEANKAGASFDLGAHPRAHISLIVERLRQLGVKVVALDYYFPVPEPVDPAELRLSAEDGKAQASQVAGSRNLVRAIQAFEGVGERRGWIGFGTNDWPWTDGMVDPLLKDVEHHAHAIKALLSQENRDTTSEAAAKSAQGISLGSLAIMTAAAWFNPLATLQPVVEFDPEQNEWVARVTSTNSSKKAPGESALRGRSGKAPTIGVELREVHTLDDTPANKPLGSVDRDTLAYATLFAVPDEKSLAQATLDVSDLWRMTQDDLAKKLNDRVVIVGDQCTADGGRLVDRYARDGQAPPIWGVEIQATFIQAYINAFNTDSGFSTDVSGTVANVGLPMMAIGGLAFGWWSTRRKPLISGWYVLTVTGGVLLVCCAAAAASLVGPMWVWNPFLMPVSFGLAAGAGVLAPWLRV
ncbi:MAG: protein kinase [Planctomycetota bacterium]|nr:protein kinase [Planctomycetota bacterium]